MNNRVADIGKTTDIVIRGITIPEKCPCIAWSDPEYGADCMLMPGSKFNSFEEQYDQCPIMKILGKYNTIYHSGEEK